MASSKKQFAIYERDDGRGNVLSGKVEVLARTKTYSMVKHPRCMPFVVLTKQLKS